jgi:hypothetical protein
MGLERVKKFLIKMIRENINKIDYELKELFNSVKIEEKSNKGNYYLEINASTDIHDKKDASVKAEISLPDLNSKVIKWSYYTNPKSESDKVERVSSIDTISNDIYDVVNKKRMDIEYFESLEDIKYEMVNESAVTIEQKEELEKKLEDILKRFEVEEVVLNESKYDDNVLVNTLVFRKNLKPTDLYMLDINLKSAGYNNVEYVNDTIKVQIYK